MGEEKKVAVVILSWNGREFLERFLPSVVRFTSPELCEIVVADNDSSDDSVEFVRKTYPSVRVIQNKENNGFAGGYNDALKQVNCPYYVLLNQDVEVTPNWVEKVIAEIEKDSMIAVAQPKLLAFDKRDHFEYAGASGGYLDKFGYAFCRGRIFDTIEKDEGQYDDIKEIFWATGACLFVRSEVYWKAGALDRDFFAHQEEIDLCWRIGNMGYKIICVPSSVVYHLGGGSLPQGNPRKTYLNYRNNMVMMLKNLPAPALFCKIACRVGLDFIAALYSILKNRNLKDFFAITRAHFAFYLSIHAVIRKRKLLPFHSTRHLSDVNVVWQYFMKGRRKFSELPISSHRSAQ